MYRPPKNSLPSFNDQLFTPVDNSSATENLVSNIEDANTEQNTQISANNSLIEAFTSSFLYQTYTIPAVTVSNSTITSIPVSFLGVTGRTYMININGSCSNTTELYYIELIMTNGLDIQYQYGTPITRAATGNTTQQQTFSFSKTFLTTGTGSTVYLTYKVSCVTSANVFNTPVAFNTTSNYTTPTVTILTL